LNLELQRIKRQPVLVAQMATIVILLGAVYVLQEIDYWAFLCHCRNADAVHFAFNKTLRVIANDVLMLLLIHLWFQDKSVTKLAIYVQCIDTLLLLPLYLFIKLEFEGTSEISSPLLSQFHRLIVNPTLMILIFPAIYFQRALKH
jgi:exosortase F-associated protein